MSIGLKTAVTTLNQFCWPSCSYEVINNERAQLHCLARYMLSLSVRLCVCPSHGEISQKSG